MALCVCKCLNVTLVCDGIDEIDIGRLDLNSTEQRDIFFTEKLLSGPINLLKTQVVQPALIGQRAVGRFMLNSCFACGFITHAVIYEKFNMVLIPKSSMTTNENVNNLKKSSNFSPVFNLLVPEVTDDVEMKENIDTSNVLLSTNGKYWPPMQQAIGSLSKQMNNTLKSQLENIEELVTQFRDQKYAEFEAYREKAHRDHKILASIISKARATLDKRVDMELDNGPPSPQQPPLQRRRLSSLKDAKKISQIIKPARNIPHEEDSLDVEDIFDIEDTDSQNYNCSDQDDEDSDLGSNDEGIHISRPRIVNAQEIARSLPINMPKFGNEDVVHRREKDIDDEEEPQDIAASIKALARSVHGDVFELPRPRFSTQI